MSKLVLVVFGALTLGAGYLTVYDVGVMEPTVKQASVRQGSAHRGVGFVGGGGFRRGK